MKTYVLLVALLFGGNAFAEWTKINSDAVATDYLDIQSARKTDYGVSIWSRTEYIEAIQLPSGATVSLALNLTEYDCNNMRFRRFATHSYKDHSGKVPVSLDNSTGDWKYVAPSSYGEATLKRACSIL